MFSLIITIISIALVAALALATLYYGGNAFNKGDAQSRAAQVVVQGQQILAAADLFFADTGRWPTSLEEMVAQNYLKQVPVVSAFNDESALRQLDWNSAVAVAAAAQATAWTMPVAGKPTFVLDTKSADTCKFVNLKVRGDNGILTKAYTSLGAQCYGASDTALKVVVTKDTESLSTVLPSAEVVAGAIPAIDAAVGWLSAPGVTGTVGQGTGQVSSEGLPAGGVAGAVTITASNGGSFGVLKDYLTTGTVTITVINGTDTPVELTSAVLDNSTQVKVGSTTCSPGTVAMGSIDLGNAFASLSDALMPDALAPVFFEPSDPVDFSGGPWALPAKTACNFTVTATGGNASSISSGLTVSVKDGAALYQSISGQNPPVGELKIVSISPRTYTYDMGGTPVNATAFDVVYQNNSTYTVSGFRAGLSPVSYTAYTNAFTGSGWYGQQQYCIGPGAPGSTVMCTFTSDILYQGPGTLTLGAGTSQADDSTGPVQSEEVAVP